jgi:FMN-dependent oxidoreductase (nitrilotriacetate monooxygenase family)
MLAGRLWEGSWADDALKEDRDANIYADYHLIRPVRHQGQHFSLDGRHIVDPSPQRTPFLFQAGTSAAGMKFGATHAEAIFVSAPSPHILGPRVAGIRAAAAAAGRDPRSVKVFATVTPILGQTEAEADEKYRLALKYSNHEGGLAFFSGSLGIDLSRYDLDEEITTDDVVFDARIHSAVANLAYHGDDVPKWTPRNIGRLISIGANGPVPVGTPAQVADVLQEWVRVADLDGFNVAYVTVPGTFEEVVDLLVPELRRRGVYAPAGESGTMRERVLGAGQRHLRDDHVGRTYRYEVYDGN